MPLCIYNVKSAQMSINGFEQNKSDFESFSTVILKHVSIRKLTPTIVNESMKKNIILAPNKSHGRRRQKVKIVFGTFIGNLDTAENEQTIDRQRKSKTA